MKHSSRPRTTQDLVERLKELDLGFDDDQTTGRQTLASEFIREVNALRALSYSMVQTFYNDPKRLYATEAALLSPFINEDDSYILLFNAFVTSIANDSGEGGIPDTNLLASFSSILYHTKAKLVGKRLQLGHAINCITTRLKEADGTADGATQYQLLRTLSAILDVMNEVKFEGISDVKIVQPLFELLEDASRHPELRLSQAARYAYQALRGISSDISPWEKLGVTTWNVFKGGAIMTGSVWTLDPAKFLEGLEALGEIARLVKTITDVIEEFKNVRDAKGKVQSSMKPRQWYLALRYTDLIIRGTRHTILKSVLESLESSLKKDINFLCGLCAQLEQAIHVNSNNEAIKVLKEFLIHQSTISKSRRVHEWIKLVTGSPKSTELPKINRFVPRLLRRSKKYLSTVKYQEVPYRSPGNVLLEKAWLTCHEVKVFYADQMIRNYYTNETLGRLNVERIGNNEKLPINKCYINLAIVQRETDENKVVKSPASSFHRRLAIWEPEKSNRVPLADLFRPKQDSGKVNQPYHRRVLIRGQAGVGKSTLCKKVVYDHIHNAMWSEIINRIIWLPLRQLKDQDMQKYDTQRLLFERYFSNDLQDGNLLAQALYDEISKEENRTLFILDGLDEVLQEASSGESTLLLSLLQKPRVIITTRPYAVDRSLIRNIDREVETVGFYEDQVKQYIEAVAPDSAVKIQTFLSSYPSVKALARIPIQLDAFCYSFEEGILKEDDGPQTMTELYGVIEQIIWKKDVVQLGKNRRGRPGAISKSEALRLNPEEINRMVPEEVNVLKTLAFDGLHNTTEEFDFKYMNGFWERHKSLSEHLNKAEYSMSPKDLDELSLLRTSDGGGAARNSSYHFLHLTFQEYFGALYFVEHWPHKKLPQLELSADEFLRAEKYNQRFNIMWRFVAGLLYAKGDVKKFFETIETKPYDLLGSSHQRLIMNCLDEIKLQNVADLDLRNELQDQIKQWLLYELRLQTDCGLKWDIDIEYPEKALQQCLSEMDDQILQRRILEVLKRRPILSINTVNQVIKYCESSDRGLKVDALKVLYSHKDVLPSNCFHSIMDLIRDSDVSIRYHASLVLSAQSDLTDEIFSELIVLLKQGSRNAFDILESFSTLPRKTLLEMVAIVPDLNEGNTRDIIRIFDKQFDLPEDIILMMLDLIQQRSRSEKLLKSMWNKAQPRIAAKQSGRIAPKVVEKLLNMLRDPNSNVREAVAYIFRGYKLKDDSYLLHKIIDLLEEPNLSNGAQLILSFNQDLPENILYKIIDCLENYNTGIQSTATIILNWQNIGPSTTILQRMSSLLDNPRKRYCVTEELHKHRSLPEPILQTVLRQFKDPRTRLQNQEYVLSSQLSLPNSILQELVDLLQAEDAKLRCMAREVLSTQSILPEVIIRKTAILLDCKNIDVQYAAMQALSEQPSLPSEVLRKMILLIIWHYDESKVECIMNRVKVKLVRQFVTIPEMLLDTIRLLKHPNHRVQIGVIFGLGLILDLPEGILEELVRLLGVGNKEILDNASRVLVNQKPGLPESILKEAANLFNHSDKSVRNAVASIFAVQRSILSEEVLLQLAHHLKDFDTGMLNRLSNLLVLQPELPEKMLQDLIITLNHPAKRTRNIAADILTRSLAQSDVTFNSLFDLLDEKSFIALYKFWMSKSCGTHLTWCVDGKKSVISFSQGDRSIPLDKFKGAVRKARESLGVPYQDFGQVL